MTVSYMRQDKILNPETAASTHINIIGCGTVGSNAAMQLAKAGFGSFDLWDMDFVESHNIPSQDFSVDSIGMDKSMALAERVSSVNPTAVISHPGECHFTDITFMAETVIVAVDSMELRKEFFEYACKNSAIDLLIDFRMGGKILQAWAFSLKDELAVDRYKQTLYSSSEVIDAVCGTRTFAPIGALSGVIATELMTKHVMRESFPFYTYFDLGSFTMHTTGMKDSEDD